MQDRYAGDVGDFLKLGLLRHLAAPPERGGAGLSVGIDWYLVPDESHNGDGRHTSYLETSSRHHRSLEACDPELMTQLTHVVATGRSVAALERSGAIGLGWPTHAERIDPAAGASGRRAWHGRALAALGAAELVSVDPDNGYRLAARGPKAHKYATISELADFARHGQSLALYQHAQRAGSARAQAGTRLAEVAGTVGQVPVGAVIARRGSCRFFLVTAADGHLGRLTASLDRFAERWAPHVELVVPSAPVGRGAEPFGPSRYGTIIRPRA